VNDALKLQSLFFWLDDLTSARQLSGSHVGRKAGILCHHNLYCILLGVLCNSEDCVNSEVGCAN